MMYSANCHRQLPSQGLTELLQLELVNKASQSLKINWVVDFKIAEAAIR